MTDTHAEVASAAAAPADAVGAAPPLSSQAEERRDASPPSAPKEPKSEAVASAPSAGANEQAADGKSDASGAKPVEEEASSSQASTAKVQGSAPADAKQETSASANPGEATAPPAKKKKAKRSALDKRRRRGAAAADESEGEEAGAPAAASSSASSAASSAGDSEDDDDEDDDSGSEQDAAGAKTGQDAAASPSPSKTEATSAPSESKPAQQQSWDSMMASDSPLDGAGSEAKKGPAAKGGKAAGGKGAKAAGSGAKEKRADAAARPPPSGKLFDAGDSAAAFPSGDAAASGEAEEVDFASLSLGDNEVSTGDARRGGRGGRGGGARGVRGASGRGGGFAASRAAAEQYREKLTSDPTFTPRVGQFWGHDERLMDGSMRKLSGWWRERGAPGQPAAPAPRGAPRERRGESPQPLSQAPDQAQAQGAAEQEPRPANSRTNSARGTGRASPSAGSARGAYSGSAPRGSARGGRGVFRGTAPAPRGKNFKGSGMARSGLLGWNDADDDLEEEEMRSYSARATASRAQPASAGKKDLFDKSLVTPAPQDNSATTAQSEEAPAAPAAAPAPAGAPEGRWGHDGFSVLQQQGERPARGAKGSAARRGRNSVPPHIAAAVAAAGSREPQAGATAQQDASSAQQPTASPAASTPAFTPAAEDSAPSAPAPANEAAPAPAAESGPAPAPAPVRPSAPLRAPSGPNGSAGFAAVRLGGLGAATPSARTDSPSGDASSAGAAAGPRTAAAQLAAGTSAAFVPPVRLPGSARAPAPAPGQASAPASESAASSAAAALTPPPAANQAAAATSEERAAAGRKPERQPAANGSVAADYSAAMSMQARNVPMLPPGYAMDASGMVYDLQNGRAQPIAVGYYPPPQASQMAAMQMQSYYAAQAQAQAAAAAASAEAWNPAAWTSDPQGMPQRGAGGKHGHAHHQQQRGQQHGSHPSNIPASAARVAEFQPGSASGSGSRSDTPLMSPAGSSSYGSYANGSSRGGASAKNAAAAAAMGSMYAAGLPYDPSGSYMAMQGMQGMHYMDPYGAAAGTPTSAAALAAMYAGYGASPGAYDGQGGEHGGYYRQM